MNDRLLQLIIENNSIIDLKYKSHKYFKYLKCSFSFEDFSKILVFIFQEGSLTPIMIAKLCRSKNYEKFLVNQYERLRKIVDMFSEDLKTTVPKMQLITDPDENKIVIEEYVSGKSFAAYRRNRFTKNQILTDKFLMTGTKWLEKLHFATISDNQRTELTTYILTMINSFEKHFTLGETEKSLLNKLKSNANVIATELNCFVATHGDFGPRNLLIGDNHNLYEGLRVIDWEFLELKSIPLFDLLTFLMNTGMTEVGGYKKKKRQKEFLHLLLGTSHASLMLKKYLQRALSNLDIKTSLIYYLFPLCLIKLSVQHLMWYNCKTDTSKLWRERFSIYTKTLEDHKYDLPFGIG